MEADLAPEHRAILDDGAVTFEEYEWAVLDSVACLEEAGFEVVGPELRFKGKQYVYSARGDAELDARECFGKNQVIEVAWSLQNTPSESELQRARGALEECLRDAGLPIPEEPDEGDLTRFAGSPVHRRCSLEVSEEYGLPFFGG